MAYIEMTYASDILKRWTDITVILPLESAGNPELKKPDKFPTLYLLHGFGGNSKDWVTYSNIRRYAEERNLAVVMPSGENTFYVDNEGMGLYNGIYIKDLVEFTRKAFPLSAKREETFIGGLSMGGFGALRNGLYYPDIFSGIISLSGAFIIEDIDGAKEGSQIGIESYEYYHRVFGDLNKVKETFANPTTCARRALENGVVPRIFMACGTEDFVLGNNRHQHEALKELGIQVEYHEDSGTHDWNFWDKWIVRALDWIGKTESCG